MIWEAWNSCLVKNRGGGQRERDAPHLAGGQDNFLLEWVQVGMCAEPENSDPSKGET